MSIWKPHRKDEGLKARRLSTGDTGRYLMGTQLGQRSHRLWLGKWEVPPLTLGVTQILTGWGQEEKAEVSF